MRIGLFFIIMTCWSGIAGAAEKIPVDPACFKNYLKMISLSEMPKGSFLIKNLPKKIVISTNKKEALEMFSLANEAWRTETHLGKIRKAVNQLAERDFSVLDDEMAAEFKSSRKYGTIIRNSFNLFDITHEVPEALNTFVVRFGKLNDLIKLGSKKEIAKAARRLQKSFDLLPEEDVILLFNPEKRAGFQSYMEEALGEIKGVLREKKLTSTQYHDTRKAVRRLCSYFQARQAVYPSKDNAKIMQFLKQLSDEMGEEHDQVVAAAIAGKQKYDDANLVLSKGLQEKLAEVLKRTRLEN